MQVAVRTGRLSPDVYRAYTRSIVPGPPEHWSTPGKSANGTWTGMRMIQPDGRTTPCTCGIGRRAVHTLRNMLDGCGARWSRFAHGSPKMSKPVLSAMVAPKRSQRQAGVSSRVDAAGGCERPLGPIRSRSVEERCRYSSENLVQSIRWVIGQWPCRGGRMQLRRGRACEAACRIWLSLGDRSIACRL